MANKTAAIRYSPLYQKASDLQVLPEESAFPALIPKDLLEVFPSGLRRGSIAEIYGSRSSGRTSVALRILAEATQRGEVVAVVDLQDSFCPHSACQAGVALDRMVWVKCRGNAEHAVRACDLLLHAGGFGVVILDLCEAAPRVLNRLPISYWYRFRRVLESTPTVLLLCTDAPQAKSTARQQLHTKARAFKWSGDKPLAVLRGLETCALQGKIASIRPISVYFQAVV